MPSNYYTYDFVSPDRLYARVQEEMRSYFSTGAVDSLMFPIWTEDCIRKFRKTYLPIREDMVQICNGVGELPADCQKIREAWTCNTTWSPTFRSTHTYYYPETCIRTVTNQTLGTDCSHTHQFIHKVTGEEQFSFTTTLQLREGNIRECGNSYGLYEIQDGRLHVSTTDGTVYITYYSDGRDDQGYQLVPSDFFFENYLRKYLIYQVYKTVFNQTNDEGFNVIYRKLKDAEQEMNEAYILADIESKKETLSKKLSRIARNRTRNNKYHLK